MEQKQNLMASKGISGSGRIVLLSSNPPLEFSLKSTELPKIEKIVVDWQGKSEDVPCKDCAIIAADMQFTWKGGHLVNKCCFRKLCGVFSVERVGTGAGMATGNANGDMAAATMAKTRERFSFSDSPRYLRLNTSSSASSSSTSSASSEEVPTLKDNLNSTDSIRIRRFFHINAMGLAVELEDQDNHEKMREETDADGGKQDEDVHTPPPPPPPPRKTYVQYKNDEDVLGTIASTSAASVCDEKAGAKGHVDIAIAIAPSPEQEEEENEAEKPLSDVVVVEEEKSNGPQNKVEQFFINLRKRYPHETPEEREARESKVRDTIKEKLTRRK